MDWAINVDIIIEQWDQLVRLAATPKDRLRPALAVMHRLIIDSVSSRLANQNCCPAAAAVT
jgi:hypothetical protein